MNGAEPNTIKTETPLTSADVKTDLQNNPLPKPWNGLSRRKKTPRLYDMDGRGLGGPASHHCGPHCFLHDLINCSCWLQIPPLNWGSAVDGSLEGSSSSLGPLTVFSPTPSSSRGSFSMKSVNPSSFLAWMKLSAFLQIRLVPQPLRGAYGLPTPQRHCTHQVVLFSFVEA